MIPVSSSSDSPAPPPAPPLRLHLVPESGCCAVGRQEGAGRQEESAAAAEAQNQSSGSSRRRKEENHRRNAFSPGPPPSSFLCSHWVPRRSVSFSHFSHMIRGEILHGLAARRRGRPSGGREKGQESGSVCTHRLAGRCLPHCFRRGEDRGKRATSGCPDRSRNTDQKRGMSTCRCRSRSEEKTSK